MVEGEDIAQNSINILQKLTLLKSGLVILMEGLFGVGTAQVRQTYQHTQHYHQMQPLPLRPAMES